MRAHLSTSESTDASSTTLPATEPTVISTLAFCSPYTLMLHLPLARGAPAIGLSVPPVAAASAGKAPAI